MRKARMCLVPDYRGDMTEEHRKWILETHIEHSTAHTPFIITCRASISNHCLVSTLPPATSPTLSLLQ